MGWGGCDENDGVTSTYVKWTGRRTSSIGNTVMNCMDGWTTVPVFQIYIAVPSERRHEESFTNAPNLRSLGPLDGPNIGHKKDIVKLKHHKPFPNDIRIGEARFSPKHL